MSSVIEIKEEYERIYLNDDFFKKQSRDLGQFMIVDCGSPRSLMGDQECNRLAKVYNIEKVNVPQQRFKFGPSRIYPSTSKVILPLKLGKDTYIKAEFFIVKGEVPMLLGNDVMEPLGGNIDMENRKLEFKKVEGEVPIVKTPGGHFIIPISSVAEEKGTNTPCDTVEEAINLKGPEAEVVMLIMLAETETNDDLMKLHNEIGHSIFASLALNDDEEAQIKKVHRYFGHRSGRRIWDLFAKADKLKGKRKAVLDVIENCKICSQMKKAPRRPKVGYQ
jgi:hypothetical protein